MSQSDKPIEVFISYSKHDLPLLEQLISHLSNLIREQQINIWYDRQMTAGEEWSDEINERLNSAGMVFLLISRDFLSSKYCFDVELPHIIKRQEKGETVVVPILLSACEWEKAAFSQYQLLPSTRIPVASWPNMDEAFRDVVIGIRKAVEKLRGESEERARAILSKRAISRHRLPYLCDRSDQEIHLGENLLHYQTKNSGRPILCVIHGDELECHGDFLWRLRYKSLPKFLDLELKQMSVKEYELPLPRRISDQAFRASLGEALLGDSSASREEIWQFVSQHQEPMMISLHLMSADIEEGGESLIHSFLEFCANWPDLPAGRWLLYCLCLKYQRGGKAGFFDFLKKNKRQQLNERLRKQIEGMEFSKPSNVFGVVLPELQAITRRDVEWWSRNICHIPEKEIRAWFETETAISMEDLVGRLQQYV